MKILFLSGREVTYPRNAMMLHALQQLGQVQVINPRLRRQSILLRSLLSSVQASPHLRSTRYDLIFTGFFGQALMYPAGWLARAPILFDAFISAYDTLIFDREKASPNAPLARLAYQADRHGCQAAEHVLLDTACHVDYFTSTFKIPAHKFSRVFVGCDEKVFYPRPAPAQGQPVVLFYGTFLPLHGLEIILRAAAEVPGVQFRLIGEGPQLKAAQKLAADLGLKNTTFLPSVPLNALPQEIAAADVCLGGHFGGSQKAARVIAGKTFQYLAMGKAAIVAENPANHELLTHAVDAWFCPPSDAQALAQSIRTLCADAPLRARLGEAGRQVFEARASTPVLNAEIAQIVKTLIAAR